MWQRALFGFCLVVVFCVTATGCGKSPDQMTTPEFQAWLKDELRFSDLSLTERRPGYFTGTGKSDGTTFQLTVTRKGREVTWEAIPHGGDVVQSGSLSW
jgi:hypothetical protein